jgi:hypothetical protein
MQWLVIAGGVLLIGVLVVLRRRMLDVSGPGRLVPDESRKPWDGRPRRASDRSDER